MKEDLKKRKQVLRETISKTMEEHIASFPLPAHGRKPNLKNSHEAASKFLILEPESVRGKEAEAATIKGALLYSEINTVKTQKSQVR
jgi:hypothetical protein